MGASVAGIGDSSGGDNGSTGPPSSLAGGFVAGIILTGEAAADAVPSRVRVSIGFILAPGDRAVGLWPGTVVCLYVTEWIVPGSSVSDSVAEFTPCQESFTGSENESGRL